MTAKQLVLLASALITMAGPALAHDPSQHRKPAATGPDCAKMQGMDMSKMDANDPVMKALRKKCQAHMQSDANQHRHPPAADGAAPPATSREPATSAAMDCAKAMAKGPDAAADAAQKTKRDECARHMKHDESSHHKAPAPK